MVAAAICTIFAQPQADMVRDQLGAIAAMLGRQFSKVEAMLRDAAEDLPAACPKRRGSGWETQGSGWDNQVPASARQRYRRRPRPREVDVAAARLIVRADHGFDGERPLDGAVAVFVEEAQITVVSTATEPPPEGWPVADFPSAMVLPGLIDMHVHLCGDGGPNALERLPGFGDDQLAAVIDDGLRRHLAAGVTTVRDLGDRRWAVLERRDAARPGHPTIVASGPPITSVRGHCWHMGGEVAGPDQLRAAVRERAERRVDVVKVMASGGGTTPGSDVLGCQFTLDELRTVVDEAHAAGLPVTAHAHALSAVEQALAAGVDGIEHCSFATVSGVRTPAAVVEDLARQRVVVCPTLGWLNPVSGDRGRPLEIAGGGVEAPAPLLYDRRRAGRDVGAGSDRCRGRGRRARRRCDAAAHAAVPRGLWVFPRSGH